MYQKIGESYLIQDIIALVDVVRPWTPGRHQSPVAAISRATKCWCLDLAGCAMQSIDYLPVVFPGFKWHHIVKPIAQFDTIPHPKTHGQILVVPISIRKRFLREMIFIS